MKCRRLKSTRSIFLVFFFRCLEGKGSASKASPNTQLELRTQNDSEALDLATGGLAGIPDVKRSSSSSGRNSKLSEINGRRTSGHPRYRKRRPASFDTALIANRTDDPSTLHVTCVVTSTPSSNPSVSGNPQPMFWDVTSSSGCSSDSGSYLDSDSDIDERLNEAFINKYEKTEDENEEEKGTEKEREKEKENFTMSAEEEAALRMTVGRGHFSRSKKDRFLNHLRLEKRLNGLNYSISGINQRGHGRHMERRYSGDLYRIVY